jgi:hypothetical protein
MSTPEEDSPDGETAELRFWKARSLLVRTMTDHMLKRPQGSKRKSHRSSKTDVACKILDGLYLSAAHIEENMNSLEALKVTHVLQVQCQHVFQSSSYWLLLCNVNLPRSGFV